MAGPCVQSEKYKKNIHHCTTMCFFKNKSNIRRKIQPQAIGPKKKIFFCEIEFYEFVSKKVEKCSSNNIYLCQIYVKVNYCKQTADNFGFSFR